MVVRIEWHLKKLHNFHVLPIEAIPGVTIRVELPDGEIVAQLWRVAVGRMQLILLDTNFAGNSPEHRKITDQLYGGDLEIAGKAHPRDQQGKHRDADGTARQGRFRQRSVPSCAVFRQKRIAWVCDSSLAESPRRGYILHARFNSLGSGIDRPIFRARIAIGQAG